MKFLDKATGNILETENILIVEQYKKYSDRYEAEDKNGKFPTLEKKARLTAQTKQNQEPDIKSEENENKETNARSTQT